MNVSGSRGGMVVVQRFCPALTKYPCPRGSALTRKRLGHLKWRSSRSFALVYSCSDDPRPVVETDTGSRDPDFHSGRAAPRAPMTPPRQGSPRRTAHPRVSASPPRPTGHRPLSHLRPVREDRRARAERAPRTRSHAHVLSRHPNCAQPDQTHRIARERPSTSLLLWPPHIVGRLDRAPAKEQS